MKPHLRLLRPITFLTLGFLLAALSVGLVWGRPATPAPASQPSPLHPPYPLLDDQGVNVLESGRPVSTMKTCGECHDTDFIVTHNFHADLGLSDYAPKPGALDAGPGTFGKWNPLTYRYLSQPGDSRFDLTTPEWLMLFGERIPGGGPATTSRDGRPLTALRPDPSNPETAIVDPKTGKVSAWDWNKSGVMEPELLPLPHGPARPGSTCGRNPGRALRLGQHRYAPDPRPGQAHGDGLDI